MSGLFTSISGQFGKAFSIGFLFPSVIFLTLAYFFLAPMLPWRLDSLSRYHVIETQWQIALFTAAAVVVAAILYVLNNAIIRSYEGYPWARGLIGTSMVEKHRDEVERNEALLPLVHYERMRLETLAADELAAQTAALERGERSLIFRRLEEYPKAASVLPTRLGNVIRAFENYPQRQYKIAAIALWPHFTAKIDGTYASSMDDAKSQFDFALNLSLLCTILFLAIALIGVAFPVPFATGALLLQWLLKLVFTASAAVFLYYVAVARAKEWGLLVRGAFDLYRRKVLPELGFDVKPATLKEERALWESISLQYSYGDPIDETWKTLTFAPSAIRVSPNHRDLHVTRTVEPIVNGTRVIHTCIRNEGPDDIKSVALIETISGRQLQDDASIGTKQVLVNGVNPYRFAIGTVPGNGSIELKYTVTEP